MYQHRSTLTLVIFLAISTRLYGNEPKQPKFVLTWGKMGEKAGEFYSPIGIAINAQDEVFVTDLNNARLQRFNAEGKHLGGFDLPLDNPPRRTCLAGGIALGPDGLIYLSFMGQHKVCVYKDDGTLVREWGKKGSADGEFHQPGGLVLARDGTLLVADQCNHRIQRFTPEGKYLGRIGDHGSGPGQFGGLEAAGSRFAGPHFVAQDSRSRLYTTEGVEGRVQQFSPDGNPLLAWGNKGSEPGGFGAYQFGGLKNTFGPIAVVVDRHDRVWVSSLNDRVQCFTPEGKFLMGIGLEGSGAEPGQLDKPHGMAFDSRGNLYICDAGNERIQRFEVPGP